MWPFTSAPTSKELVVAKQEARKAALKSSSTYSDAYTPYLHASASDIVERIEEGRWSASEVLEAYIARATLAHAETNCITEVLFEEARREARGLDEYFRTHRRLKGPLHGVPVSFKDVYDIAGYDSTMGHTKFAFRPSASDAELVQIVRDAGGVPFVKTNLSQCMLFFECVNPIWGRTLNPYSKAHTCGGSSGGEGALIAADGSPLGWGSDIGGSIRIPASYCGIYGLKPGHARVTSHGSGVSLPGFEAIHTVCGPMGRTVADIELACRVAFGQPSVNYDPAPLPYRNVQLPRKLRFGYYLSDDFVKPSPVCQRAVLETVEALRREGHECIEFSVPDPGRPMELFLSLANADGNRTAFSPIGSDPKQAELATVSMGPSMFGWSRWLVSWLLDKVFGDRLFSRILYNCRERRVDEYWRVIQECKEYSRMFNKEIWEKCQLDGIIAPVQALPALPHQAVQFVASISAATILYNVVDSPVGVVPVTRVDPEIDAITEEWFEGPGHGSPMLEFLLYNKWSPIYDPKKAAGLPVGIQVVGRKWEEEKVIEMMKVVDSALGKRGFGPGSWKPTKY